jgi:hypothetical protein
MEQQEGQTAVRDEEKKSDAQWAAEIDLNAALAEACKDCEAPPEPKRGLRFSWAEAISYGAQCVAFGALLPGVLEELSRFL